MDRNDHLQDATAGFGFASPQLRVLADDGVSAAPLDLILIEGFIGETVIGINPDEATPQPLRIDLAAGLAKAAACTTDDIGDTIHYGHVRKGLVRLMAGEHALLLEAFAEQIARMVLDDFGAHWVRVRVAKPRKYADVLSVGVEIERRRANTRTDWHPQLGVIGRGLVPAG